MEDLIKTTLIGLFFGTFGTTLGGIIGITFKNTSNKFLSFILSMASRAYDIYSVLWISARIFRNNRYTNYHIRDIIWCYMYDRMRHISSKKFNTNIKYAKNQNTLLRTGIIVSIGLALHNFPEGLAIGSGFGASIKLRIFTSPSNIIAWYSRRSIDGSSNEKWWNEGTKSNFLCDTIWSNNRNRSFLWRINTEAYQVK